PRRRAVSGVERRLPATRLPLGELDLEAGRAQQRLRVVERLREHEIAEAGGEELDAADGAHGLAGSTSSTWMRVLERRRKPRSRRARVARISPRIDSAVSA